MNQELKSKLNSLSPQQLKELLKRAGKEKKELPRMPRNAAQQYPVTSAQKRMWFLSKLDPGSHLYTNPVGIRVKTGSPADVDLYVHGFRNVVQRHEIMRTSFFSRDGAILQQIHDRVSFDIEKLDLRALPEAEKQARVDEALARDGQTVIDVEDFPLFKFRQIVLSDREFVLLYTSHHIISDAWSSSHIFREMQELYERASAGGDLELPPLKYQFVDYVHWEQTWAGSADYQQAVSKWEQLLPAAPEPLRLPLDYVRPEVIRYEGGLEKAVLNADLVGRLRDFSKSEGVNLFHTLLAAFNVLLHRYSGNEEIVVGIPQANRKIREFQQTVGMFLNTLPHRTDIDPTCSFRDYLRQVRDVSQDMAIHQDLPFEKLIERVKPARDLAVSPVFQVLFVFQNIPDMYQWDGLEVTPVKPDYHISKYELNLWVEEVDDRLFLSLTYQTHLFRQETVQAFLHYYEALLESVINAPEQPLAAVPVGTTAVLPATVPTIPEAPASSAPWFQAFEALAVKQPGALALVHADTRLSYEALNEHANRLAHHLLQVKRAEDTVIAFLLPRSAQQILAILAIHKAGCSYLPLDPALPADALQSLLETSGVRCVLTENAFQEAFTNGALQVVLLDGAQKEIQQ